MMRASRTIDTWDPERALRIEWPEWSIQVVTGMASAELFVPIARTCLVDKGTYDQDPFLMMAHVNAHLTLHLEQMGGQLNDDHCDEADDLAGIWLDRPIDLWEQLPE